MVLFWFSFLLAVILSTLPPVYGGAGLTFVLLLGKVLAVASVEILSFFSLLLLSFIPVHVSILTRLSFCHELLKTLTFALLPFLVHNRVPLPLPNTTMLPP